MDRELQELLQHESFKKMEEGARLLLEGLSEVTGRFLPAAHGRIQPSFSLQDPNFIKTPYRVAKAWLEMCIGLANKNEVVDILKTNFPSDYTGMIIIDSIDAFSVCPHHALPVQYKVDFGYIPNEKMLGLSKIPRFIKLLAKQPILQEDFTKQIIDKFNEHVKPQGCIVIVKGVHNCMVCRGVGAINSSATTSEVSGNFDNLDTRTEFLELVKKNK
jgi:GTP cyclohydrolase I